MKNPFALGLLTSRFVLGIVILLAAAALLNFWPIICETIGLCQKAVTVLYGEIGGSKEGLFQDEGVQRILKDKYGLQVTYTTLGGEDQVCTAPAKAPRDFVWPGTEISVERYKACHGGAAAKGAVGVLISPIVFYSWADVANAFTSQGWIEEAGGIYYLDMTRLTPVLMQGQPWKNVGLDIYGNINVVSTDPANSNSGQVWAALLATMLNNGEVPTVDSVKQVQPDVKKYFDRLGLMLKKSSDLFERTFTVGMGDKPIIVGYESLLPDYMYKNKKDCSTLASVRVIYPRPTVWASHPLIAETNNGLKLQQALKDPEIQKLAWERHGFRAPLGSVSNPLAANCLKVPPTIQSTVPLPDPDVMDELIKYVTGTTTLSPAAVPTTGLPLTTPTAAAK